MPLLTGDLNPLDMKTVLGQKCHRVQL